MFKKVLTTTVLSVSVLGAMAANAATSNVNIAAVAPSPASGGVYVTGQLGYANTHLGSKTDFADFDLKTSNQNLSNNGLAGRIALGYQFNQNFAVEAGYLQLGDRKGNISLDKFHLGTHLINGSIRLQQNVIDVVGKGIIPMADKINVYGKLGVAYISTPIQGSAQINPDVITPATLNVNLNEAVNIAKHQWAPEAAIGVNYDITPNVSVDTSWTHIQPLGNNRPGNIDFIAVGLGYNFG